MGMAATLRPPRLSLLPRAAALGGPLAVLSAASLAGTLVAPALVTRNPLVLAALAPRSVFLVAAAARTPFPLFMAVGLVRLSLAGPPHFAIGRTWGRDASAWLLRGPLALRVTARATEWLFQRLGPLALLVCPTGKTVALASASDVPAARVVVSVFAGVAARLVFFYVLAHR